VSQAEAWLAVCSDSNIHKTDGDGKSSRPHERSFDGSTTPRWSHVQMRKQQEQRFLCVQRETASRSNQLRLAVLSGITLTR
jgi:hypothetical protein